MILTLFAAFSTAAQSQESSAPTPPAPSQDSAPPAETKKPKKVWTNENLSGANSAVFVVGDPKNKPKPSSSKPANAQYLASVRKQLDKLQGEIAGIDKQLVDLKNFSDGKPSTVREWHQTQQKLRARAHRGPNARLAGQEERS